MKAARYGLMLHLKILLIAGADVGMSNDGGLTPLHMAASSDSVEAVEPLLTTKAKVHAASFEHGTPLHSAYVIIYYVNCESFLNITRTLLKAGVNTEARVSEGNTVPHKAIRVEAFAIEQLGSFWTYGEEYDAIPWRYSEDGRSYLSARDAVGMLISVNSRICPMSNTKGLTPLHETLGSLMHLEDEKAEFAARAQTWVNKSDWIKSRNKTYDTVHPAIGGLRSIDEFESNLGFPDPPQSK